LTGLESLRPRFIRAAGDSDFSEAACFTELQVRVTFGLVQVGKENLRV
jgi:hypothetical protein